jgi:hemophore-related protein
MRIRPKLLAAGAGVTVLLAVGVPAVASAESGSTPGAGTSTAAAANCPAQVARQSIATYVAAHPDVAEEMAPLRALPRDKRPAARKAYLAQHADVAKALQGARTAAGAGLPGRLGSLGDFLAAHPDVATLLDQLPAAPAGQRAQAAQTYLSAHPQTKTELLAGLKRLRAHARSCRAGGN